MQNIEDVADASTTQLPNPVLVELSRAGIEPLRFDALLETFGPLSGEGQMELVNRLIEARMIYAIHRRMHECDRDDRPGKRRERLEEIGATAARLFKLLHRDGTDSQPWHLHPAITLAFPALYRIALERRPTTAPCEPNVQLRILAEILGDLVALSDRAGIIVDDRFPRSHGGERREGPMAAAELIQALIETYASLRARFPESGRPLAFGKALIQFVRAGLEFAVSYPPIIDPDGVRYEHSEAAFVDADLPKPARTSDKAIQGILTRWRAQSKAE
jgi:hypothetical protein